MKAREWVREIESNADDLAGVFCRFVEEIGDIAAKRGGTFNAVEGAVKEQRAKWRSVCRRTAVVVPGRTLVASPKYNPVFLRGLQAKKRGEVA